MATGTQVAHPAGGGATFGATTGELSGRAGIVCVRVLPGSWGLYELFNLTLSHTHTLTEGTPSLWARPAPIIRE